MTKKHRHHHAAASTATTSVDQSGVDLGPGGFSTPLPKRK